MSRLLDSVNQCGYVEEIDVDESEFETVVAMLGLTDAEKLEAARHRIHGRLEDLKTARSRTVKAGTISEDVRDLEQLAKFTNPAWVSERLNGALDAFESFKAGNLVLHRRLESLFGGRKLHDLFTAFQQAEEVISFTGQEIGSAISMLKGQFDWEDGRGRPSDHAARRFASSLYQIWVEFTAGRTSRQNAFGREKDPFGDFVDAAGKLIEPDFKGHYHARQIHEASRQSPNGDK